MQGAAENTDHSAIRNVTRPPVIITNLVPGLIYEFKVVTPSINTYIGLPEDPCLYICFCTYIT